MSVVPAAAPERMDDGERRAVRAAVDRVLADGPWILGPEVERFQREFAAYVTGDSQNVHTAIGVGNGTDALALAFLALGLPPGSGVLVAANEGGYAPTALRMVGLEPIVMDVQRDTMAPDAADAEVAMLDHVSAIVVTHLHGDAVDVRALDDWRRSRGIRLIEDCAQATGARRDGVHVGLAGDVAAFSFYPTKNLGAIGDAGLLLARDPSVAQRAAQLRQYGWGTRFRVDLPGGRNSRMDALQAAILTARLPFLNARNLRRRSIAGRYREALVPSPDRLHGDSAHTVVHHAVIVTERRDELRAFLDERGIRTDVHYPHTLAEMPALGPRVGPAPIADELTQRILSVPCFPEMTENEVDRVVVALTEWARSARATDEMVGVGLLPGASSD
ncbi:MAG: DegT/DnrJ/EryC1/StrS family aminotransferase [Salinibacterium sp.]|nr:DegT/DnrJ/EryC1/StrS family aminotransferase [Salinibacterium sp.]